MLPYYWISTFRLSTLSGDPGNIGTMKLDLIAAIAVNVIFGTGVAVLWCSYFRAEATEKPERRVGHDREEIEIDPANIPQYQATWRNIQ